MLKLNSSGEEVKKLQIKLGLKPDGIFGTITESKVKEWQSQNGLVADGIVGEKTWRVLFGGVPNNPQINLNKLKGYISDNVINELSGIIEKYKLNKIQVAHFLSQCSHESGNFKIVRENLNYTINRMLEIFKYDFDTNKDGVLSISEKKKADLLKGSPEKIANFVYSNQNGNGNENSGDGWKYSGRGYIQLTGRSNYEAFDKVIEDDIISNPDLVATKYPLESAAFFFEKNKLWTICISDTTDTIKKLTKRINGGYNGLNDRIKKFNEIYNLL